MKKKWFAGIDISKNTLDVVLHNVNLKKVDDSNYIQVKNLNQGHKELLDWFRSKKVALSQLVICMEHTGVYGFDICLFLEKRKVDYCMVSPLHISRSMGFKRGKNDKIDALRIASYCYTFRDSLVYSKLKDSTVIRLRRLSAEHKLYVRQAASHKAQLTDRKDRKKDSTSERATSIVEYLNAQIKAIETEMDELIEGNEAFSTNYHLLQSIKGIGPVNAINTILHTNNFTCFENARQYACYAGIAPFEHTSGTSIKGKARVSKHGNKMLKADLSQASRSAVQWDTELHEYYKRKEAQGKEFWTIMNAVKFKLVCRMFAVVKRGTPWVDMRKYIN